MSIQKAEMSIEQIENGQIVEHVAYPYVEYEHVTMENGMDIMSMIRDDVSTPMVTHNTTNWKVGQGDSNVSETIVDSSVASMTIKGQTYQNILPEPSLRNSMTNGKTMQKLNEGYESVNTVDGVCKSAILKGNTLVNLIHSKNVINNYKKYVTIKNFIENKQYIAIFPYITNAKYAVYNMTMNTFIIDYTTSNKLIFTSPSSAYEVRLYVSFDDTTMELPSNALDIVCIEYQDGMENWDIPYFTGMQSVKLPVLKTTGKNLFDGFFEKGAYAATSLDKTNDSSGTRYIINEPFTVEKIQYAISIADDYQIFVRCFKNRVLIKDGAWVNQVTFDNTNGNYDKITIVIRKMDNSIIDENILFKLQIEQGKVVTPYEPYKSNILTVNEDVELRGIGEVKDELDLTTGELTQRIGEIILNGSETWTKGTNNSNDESSLFYTSSQNGKGGAGSVISNNFKSIDGYTIDYGTDGIYLDNSSDINIRISNSKLVSNDVNGFKTWLQSNPTTIQYKIATESIKTVDLSILDQDNQPTTQLNSFVNGYIQVSSQGLIPSVDYEVPTSNSYHVDLMKPNTQYTMKNMQGTFTIDNIQYNASTNGTFTSPSALTNNFMITSVAQSQPMLLEGDMTSKEVPYVEGIKSAFEGADKVEIYSVGENLFDFTNSGLRDESTYDKGMNGYGFWSFAVQLQPNKEVTISRKNSDGYNLGLNLKVHNENNYNGGRWLIANHAQNENKNFTTLSTNSDGYIWLIFSNNFNKINQILDICEYIKIEYGRVATPYEPYKSNTTLFQLSNPLRSLPNGVRDEIILDRVNHKARIIQRVGEDLTQLDTPIVTEVNLEGYPYVYKGGHIFLNTEIAPTTEVTYSINQAHQIESSNEDILRHQNEINHLYELIAQYVQVQYEAELIDIALQG